MKILKHVKILMNQRLSDSIWGAMTNVSLWANCHSMIQPSQNTEPWCPNPLACGFQEIGVDGELQLQNMKQYARARTKKSSWSGQGREESSEAMNKNNGNQWLQ